MVHGITDYFAPSYSSLGAKHGNDASELLFVLGVFSCHVTQDSRVISLDTVGMNSSLRALTNLWLWMP